LILREKPLFLVPPSVTDSPTDLIRALVGDLSHDDRRLFDGMSYHAEPDAKEERLALAKFQTNAISAGNNVGIFPRTARLNHGCSSAFNVVYSWREDEQALGRLMSMIIRRRKCNLPSLTICSCPRSQANQERSRTLNSLHRHKTAP
jgi:hypothetical protein